MGITFDKLLRSVDDAETGGVVGVFNCGVVVRGCFTSFFISDGVGGGEDK
jgi:hypothetical protein